MLMTMNADVNQLADGNQCWCQSTYWSQSILMTIGMLMSMNANGNQHADGNQY